MATHTEYTKKAQAWRKAHGKADGQDRDLIKAVREAGFGKDLVSNEQIIELVGYADTATGAVKKVRTWLRDLEIDAAEQAGQPAGEQAGQPATA